MSWIHEHLTLVYGIGIGVLVLTGAVLVSNKFATNIGTSEYTWGSYSSGAGRFIPNEAFDASLQAPLPPQEKFDIAELYRNLETNPDRTHASFVVGDIPFLRDAEDAAQSGTLGFSSESVDKFLAALTPSPTVINLTGGTPNTAYYFIPQSIEPPAPSNTNKLSAADRALYNYGNDAGAPIELYGTLWGSTQAFVHRGFVEDRTDEKKRADLLRLADGLSDVAGSLRGLEFMPTSVKDKHTKIVASYEAVAEKTRAIASAKTDEELIAAIDEYNKTADEFLSTYLALANVFALNNISYPETEPGRVFIYSGESTAVSQ